MNKVFVLSLVLVSGCATVSPSEVTSSTEVRLFDGSTTTWPALLSDHQETLVVFATVWCQICRRERPQVEAWARSHRDSLRTIYVFSGGELPGVVDQIRSLKVDGEALTVVVDADGRLADRYDVRSTPTLLVVDSGGHVLSTQHRFADLHLDAQAAK